MKNLPSEAERLTAAINGGMERLSALGVELKGIEMGLLDFRTILNGRECYLCWRLGEPRIEFWHDLDTGFASRQPLPPDA